MYKHFPENNEQWLTGECELHIVLHTAEFYSIRVGEGGWPLHGSGVCPSRVGIRRCSALEGFPSLKKNDSWLSSDFLVFLSKILQLNVVVSFRKASSVIEYVVCGLPVICHLFNTVLLDSHSDKTFSILCMCFSCDWDCAFLVFYFFIFFISKWWSMLLFFVHHPLLIYCWFFLHYVVLSFSIQLFCFWKL